jgi:hypothetical protein
VTSIVQVRTGHALINDGRALSTSGLCGIRGEEWR